MTAGGTEQGSEQLDMSAPPQQPLSALGVLSIGQSAPAAAEAGARPGAAVITASAISVANSLLSIIVRRSGYHAAAGIGFR